MKKIKKFARLCLLFFKLQLMQFDLWLLRKHLQEVYEDRYTNFALTKEEKFFIDYDLKQLREEEAALNLKIVRILEEMK